MKHLKTYEFALEYEGDIENAPKRGDYVICKDYTIGDIKDNIKSEIGEITEVNDRGDNVYYVIQFEGKKLRHGKKFMYKRRGVRFYEFVYWSKTYDEVDAYIQAKKYKI